jgi:hypothetical protein
MTIKAADIVPVKKVLEKSDPSGDTWVMIRPITFRDDILRGDFLEGNKSLLRAMELWITYPSKEELGGTPPCHIAVEGEDGKASEPFTDKESMGRMKFIEAIGELNPEVVLEWYQKMLEVNQDWVYRF